MERLKNFFPHSPEEGPPVPKFLPQWPWANPGLEIETGDIEEVIEQKRKEWLTRWPDRTKLIDTAIRKAREEATGLIESPVYEPAIKLAPGIKEKLTEEVLRTRLKYAEKWLETFAEP